MKQELIKNCLELQSLHVRDCGVSDYRNILDLQHELVEERKKDNVPNTIIIVEHPDVITLGVRQSANKLLVSRDEIAKSNIDIVEIRRGGGTTAHNPGQLVFYPILNLKQLSLDISTYIRTLEIIGKELLAQFNLQCDVRKGFPGLWVREKKIASIGVRVSRFVTYHGMAINIQNDLGIFDFITPCGLDNVEMTSLQKETGEQHSMSKIKKSLTQILTRYFA